MNEELEGCQYEICCNSDKYFKLQQENAILKQQLKDKDEKISKIKSYLETTYTEWFNWKSDIKDILESNKED